MPKPRNRKPSPTRTAPPPKLEKAPIDKRTVRAREMREKRRAGILRAAAQVFATEGYHEGSIADVIRAAGVSRGTFYLYFDGKRAVFDAILADLLGAISACVVPVDITSHVPAFEQLVSNIERVMEHLLANRDRCAILLRHATGVDPGFEERLAHFYRDVLALICSSLETGIEIGILRPINVRLAAIGVLGAVKETLLDAAIINPDQAVEPRILATTLLDLHLRGLLASPSAPKPG